MLACIGIWKTVRITVIIQNCMSWNWNVRKCMPLRCEYIAIQSIRLLFTYYISVSWLNPFRNLPQLNKTVTKYCFGNTNNSNRTILFHFSFSLRSENRSFSPLNARSLWSAKIRYKIVSFSNYYIAFGTAADADAVLPLILAAAPPHQKMYAFERCEVTKCVSSLTHRRRTVTCIAFHEIFLVEFVFFFSFVCARVNKCVRCKIVLRVERKAVKEKTDVCLVDVRAREDNGEKVQTRGNVLFTCVEYTITDCTVSSITGAVGAASPQTIYPTNGCNNKN